MAAEQTSQDHQYHRIESISVVGGFLDNQQFDLSDGLNCIIGARGTGKTTVLELVRYVMGAVPDDAAARKRLESLVERNLAGGRVEVGIRTKDGLKYVVSRTVGDDPVVLDESGNPVDVNLGSGALFSVDVFSQNEVEAIADTANSQLALIDNFETERIAEIDSRIRTLKADLSANASKIAPIQQKIDAVAEELEGLPSLNEKLKGLKTEGGDDAEAIDREHALKALRDRERRAILAANELMADVSRAVDEQTGRLADRLPGIFAKDMLEGPNGEWMKSIRSEINACSQDVDRLITQALERIQATNDAVAETAGKVELAHKQQDLAFQKLLEKHKEAQGKATERHRLEKRRNELTAKRRERDQLQERLQQLHAARTDLLQQLSELRDRRFTVRQSVVERINETLTAIRVSLQQFGNAEQYESLLKEALRGSGVRHNVVTVKLVAAFSPADLVAAVKQRDIDALTDKAELNPDQAAKVVAVLSGSDVLFDLETVEMVDLPKIELNDNGTYKETASLSTGQKCTTILPILLMDSDSPLLIDQPEDNLDNRFVFETVVESIGRIKQRRQLIFVTHNPNIPVLGDAERVFVLDSDGTAARKVSAGTVDQCKQEIVTLLEGGDDAFKRRKDRYGY